MTDRTLTVQRHEDPSGTVVVTVAGELDHHTAPTLARTLRDVPLTADQPTVIDLSELDYCDSTGITVLISTYQRAKAQHSALVIAGLDSGLMRVFQIAGLDQILTFAPTVEDAVRALKPAV